MPHPSSHTALLRPSALLALVCAAIVRAFDPAWLSRPVADLAREAGIRPERVTRLWRRLLASLENLLQRASTRGRKRRRRPSRKERRRIRSQALLDVAREVIRRGGVRKRRAQDFLVAARDRLREEEGISHREFCDALGLKERTVRYGARRGVAAPEEPEPVRTGRKRRPRGEGRFDLQVTLPGVQGRADTTDFELFGVGLKVVAVQDPGDRHQDLWKAFAVEEEENSEVVVRVLRDALADRPGTQLLTDPGTPYLANATREALEALEIEHAPQKEASPTKKATLERSFLTVKQALAAVGILTGRLADALPALKNAELARAFGKILLATFLKVYAAARTAPETGRPTDPVVLAAVAEAQRERVRQERRSAKQLLESLFDRYRFEGSKKAFVRAHRRFHPDDIEEAERRMGRRACRCHAQVCNRYFAAILAEVAREGSARRARARRQQETLARLEAERARVKNFREDLQARPEEGIAQGLALVACHLDPEKDRLHLDGVGLGTRLLREALANLRQESPLALLDRAEVGWRTWLAQQPEPRAVPLVRRVFERLRDEIPSRTDPETPSPRDALAATLFPGSHPNPEPRPAPGSDLRFWAARSGST